MVGNLYPSDGLAIPRAVQNIVSRLIRGRGRSGAQSRGWRSAARAWADPAAEDDERRDQVGRRGRRPHEQAGRVLVLKRGKVPGRGGRKMGRIEGWRYAQEQAQGRLEIHDVDERKAARGIRPHQTRGQARAQLKVTLEGHAFAAPQAWRASFWAARASGNEHPRNKNGPLEKISPHREPFEAAGS